MKEKAFNLLASNIKEPLCLIDAGARWGVVDSWHQFGSKAKIFCFEADKEEAERLNAERASSNVEYLPYALASDNAGRVLTITEEPGCSSTFKPIEALYEKYPGCHIMRPVRTVSCPSVSLDEFCKERSIKQVHAMKLDTQGGEFDILMGAEQMLKTCLFINVEVEFNRLYEGQPIFSDVDRFLRDAGFILWRFGNLVHYSTGIVKGGDGHIMLSVDPGSFEHVPIENGQLFWADAFYVRASAVATDPRSLSIEEAVAGACLVSQWQFWDLALEMIRKSGDQNLFAQVSAMVPPGNPIGKLSYQIDLLKRREQRLLARENDLVKQVEKVLHQYQNGLKDRFTEVFLFNHWGDSESASGWGSRRDSPSVKAALEALRFITQKYEISSINDIPCGDFNWIHEFLSEFPKMGYRGFDIVDPLIERNRQLFPQYSFGVLDVTSEIPPKADLIFCKDLVNHLPHSAVVHAIENMKASGSSYLLVTNNFGFENVELSENAGGASRHLDLTAAPFNFPAPIWHTHYLALWKLADLTRPSATSELPEHTKRRTVVETKGVTDDDIVASIEMILGRTPDRALVEYHQKLGFADRFELGKYMLGTDEFKKNYR